MKSWKDLGFEIETTGDGSPSLRLLRPSRPDREKGEAMHHSGGAFSETDLIYGSVIRECFHRVPVPRFCVVGLGLGYIETLISQESLRLGQDFQLVSYEIRDELRELFVKSLNFAEMPQDVEDVYRQVHSFVSGGQNQEYMKKNLLSKLQSGQFVLKNELTLESLSGHSFNCILYDAYSSQTDPQLWDEDFLVQFLNKTKVQPCFFSTYASRGSLKRALLRAGFTVETRLGFMGKRNSTKAFYF